MADEIVPLKISARAMDHWAAGRLVDWAAGRNATETTKAALRLDLNERADEFAGPDASPVERVLGETAALAWFALRLHEAQFVGGSTSEDGLTFKQSEHHQKRIDRAHRRLMATLKTLATVRRLGVPAVQINLARQQINVAGAMTGDAD